jgi:hypothetical protein
MWITLYDVSRDGIGIIPWFLAAIWVAGIVGGGMLLKKSPIARLFLSLWLVFWLVAGGVGYGNVFYQYAANRRALKAGSCQITEGPIENFHRQNPWKKGDSEKFVVGRHEFSYSSANLGGSGLRSSANFKLPLSNGLYVKIWYRGGIICRLDAYPPLSSSTRRVRPAFSPGCAPPSKASTACSR